MKTLPKLKWTEKQDTSDGGLIGPTATPEPSGYWADQGNRKERRRLARLMRKRSRR